MASIIIASDNEESFEGLRWECDFSLVTANGVVIHYTIYIDTSVEEDGLEEVGRQWFIEHWDGPELGSISLSLYWMNEDSLENTGPEGGNEGISTSGIYKMLKESHPSASIVHLDMPVVNKVIVGFNLFLSADNPIRNFEYPFFSDEYDLGDFRSFDRLVDNATREYAKFLFELYGLLSEE
jgi:hypothetical protein